VAVRRVGAVIVVVELVVKITEAVEMRVEATVSGLVADVKMIEVAVRIVEAVVRTVEVAVRVVEVAVRMVEAAVRMIEAAVRLDEIFIAAMRTVEGKGVVVTNTVGRLRKHLTTGVESRDSVLTTWSSRQCCQSKSKSVRIRNFFKDPCPISTNGSDSIFSIKSNFQLKASLKNAKYYQCS